MNLKYKINRDEIKNLHIQFPHKYLVLLSFMYRRKKFFSTYFDMQNLNLKFDSVVQHRKKLIIRKNWIY